MSLLEKIQKWRNRNKPWFIVIERSNIPEYNDTEWEQIVIGPFDDEQICYTYMNDSMDVEDWGYGEAKAKQYNCDEVYMTQTPDIPSYGINWPLEDDLIYAKENARPI